MATVQMVYHTGCLFVFNRPPTEWRLAVTPQPELKLRPLHCETCQHSTPQKPATIPALTNWDRQICISLAVVFDHPLMGFRTCRVRTFPVDPHEGSGRDTNSITGTCGAANSSSASELQPCTALTPGTTTANQEFHQKHQQLQQFVYQTYFQAMMKCTDPRLAHHLCQSTIYLELGGIFRAC